MATFRITVKVEGNPDWTTVEAPRDGLARTRAIADYPHPLRGQGVEYEIEEVR